MSAATENPDVTLQDYNSSNEIAWCPGCGNFGILNAVKKALVDLQIEPHKLLVVSGIGQAGKFPHYLRCNTLNELHGRAIPAATAAKIVNPELTVLAVGGDGDGYSEGGNHFIHAMHRNVDVTYIVHNNQVYALTTGQAAPTSDRGYVTKTTPGGAWEPVRALALAVASDCSFVARGFAGDIDHLAKIIGLAIRHKGFSLIEVLQPCVTFNHQNTFKWYKDRVYKLDEDANYNPNDRIAAFARALEWGDHIPTGVIYRTDRPVFEEGFLQLGPTPLYKQRIDPLQFETLLDELM
jgi:2-oxoglutarate/2-oxoacid ferredoxin oxidoreductase subunit beta